MKISEYQKLTSRTSGKWDHPSVAIAHAALGIVGEYFEFVEASESSSDLEEIILEAGDVLWYISELANHLGIGLDEGECTSQFPKELANTNLAHIAENSKKLLGYGKQIDIPKMKCALEDVVCRVISLMPLELSLEDLENPLFSEDEVNLKVLSLIMQKNIEKLQKRFPNNFSREDALAKRDQQ